MIVERIELTDIRNYESAQFDLTPGMTAVVGANGQGKTNLAEAVAYLATLSSFRGAPTDAMIRTDADAGFIRAVITDAEREISIEAELSRSGRNRVQVNRQRLAKTRDLLGVMRASVFSPDDLVIIKGGPSDRRRFLDDTLVALRSRYDLVRRELDRIVKQRNRLLKQAGGDLTEEIAITLDVWDTRMAEVGDQLGRARAALVERCEPMVNEAYEELSGQASEIGLIYDPSWRRVGLAAALADARRDDLRRAVSTIGPHRDEMEVVLDGLPTRTHASQGEQRTLALALRLAAHRLVAERTGSTPVLILDDVLSELDPDRAAALLSHLPAGQVIITTASPLPPAAHPDRTLEIKAGRVVMAGDPQ